MGDASARCETKTWLITGAARGFGREFARAAIWFLTPYAIANRLLRWSTSCGS